MTDREKELNSKKVCRFCLSQQPEKLDGIFSRDVRFKSTAPLPVQVMSITSIEVFSNDGLPSWVCIECRLLFEHSYRFKQMCKRAETLLKQYPLTGEWPAALAKPKIPFALLPKQSATATATPAAIPSPAVVAAPPPPAAPPKQIPAAGPSKIRQQPRKTPLAATAVAATPSPPAPKKLLNATPVAMPEPPAPKRLKREKLQDETEIFLLKADNDEELTIEDVQRLIAAAEQNGDDREGGSNTNTTGEGWSPNKLAKDGASGGGGGIDVVRKKPRVLNKSSMRILNKEAEVVFEPRLSEPQVKRDEDGNVAIVTEILDPNMPYHTEPDPMQNVATVETNIFPCPHCERSFPLRQLRDIHAVNHNRERSFHCELCNKSFFSKYDLQKHNLVHTGDKPFKCTICDKAFTRTTLLHRHEKCHTDIPKNICLYCEKPFISKEELEKHTERHMKKRPFQCKLCNKAFAFKQGLERHEVVHSRDQPYPCQYCDQGFLTPSKLARHLTAHAGKRPYPCKLCNKSYLLTHHLTRHMRSHQPSGGGSFTCAECNLVFKSRANLVAHSATHAMVSRCCPLCKDTFDDVDEVKAHIKEHGRDESFGCEFCDLIFLTAARLTAHNVAEHAEFMQEYGEDDDNDNDNDPLAVLRAAKKPKIVIASVEELEKTINEFLVDDLPAASEVAVVKSEAVKNEVVSPENVQRKSNTAGKKSSPVEVLHEVLIRPKNIEKPAIAKLVGDAAKALNVATPVKTGKPRGRPPGSGKANTKALTNASPREAAVKVGEKRPAPDSTAEKTNRVVSTEITTVLKNLPKSVSVRKTAAKEVLGRETAGLLKKSPGAAASTPKQAERPVRQSARRSNENAATNKSTAEIEEDEEEEDEDDEDDNNEVYRLAKNKLTSSNLEAAGVVDVTITQRKSKMQRITVTRAEANAMAREGRIRLKEGNIELAHKK